MAKEKARQLEVLCCECGNPIPSIPTWLTTASVKFECEECRQKHPRLPGMPEYEPRRTDAEDAPTAKPADDVAEPLTDLVEDEAEGDAEPEPDAEAETEDEQPTQ
jgi:hypothetical protein